MEQKTSNEKNARQYGSPPCASIHSVKVHLQATMSTLILKRTAAEYGCTKKHLKRVLRTPKHSLKLLTWLSKKHPELLNPMTNNELRIDCNGSL